MKTTIQISDEIRKRLKILAAHKSTTYDNLLDELTAKELLEMKLDGIVKNKKKIK